jgi:hypothetical protein
MRKCPNCGFDMTYAGVARKLQQSHPRAFQIWTPQEEDKLVELNKLGKDILTISRELGRHPTSIRKRIDVLGLQTPRPGRKDPEVEAYEQAVKALAEAEPEPLPANPTEPAVEH